MCIIYGKPRSSGYVGSGWQKYGLSGGVRICDDLYRRRTSNKRTDDGTDLSRSYATLAGGITIIERFVL